jgi:hypothetical protein
MLTLPANSQMITTLDTPSGAEVDIGGRKLVAATTTFELAAAGRDRFAPRSAPGAALRFLFTHEPDRASHISFGGAIFARCDDRGATRHPMS